MAELTPLVHVRVACWLKDSGRLNHNVVTHPASSLVQDRESSPADTSVLTTMLRRQVEDEDELCARFASEKLADCPLANQLVWSD